MKFNFYFLVVFVAVCCSADESVDDEFVNKNNNNLINKNNNNLINNKINHWYNHLQKRQQNNSTTTTTTTKSSSSLSSSCFDSLKECQINSSNCSSNGICKESSIKNCFVCSCKLNYLNSTCDKYDLSVEFLLFVFCIVLFLIILIIVINLLLKLGNYENVSDGIRTHPKSE